MIDKDKRYTTRDGREVRIYATDGAGEYQVHGAILKDGSWFMYSWPANGMDAIGSISNADLIEVKPRMKFERWVKVERNGDYSLWFDKPSAASSVDAFAITQIVFEVEEGEGLDAV